MRPQAMEGKDSIALRDEAIVPRSRIVKVQAQRLSLMPEGLEEGLVSQDLADLLDFIFADIN